MQYPSVKVTNTTDKPVRYRVVSYRIIDAGESFEIDGLDNLDVCPPESLDETISTE